MDEHGASHPPPPLIEEQTIQAALEALRQARPLGDSPLRRLVWVHRQIERRGRAASPVGEDVALGAALLDLVSENLARLREVEGLPVGDPPDRASTLDALRADFAQANGELEAWSALHHRYGRVDLDLLVRDMARALDTSSRQVRRRVEHGIRRLAEALSRVEAAARMEDHKLWQRLRLPPARYGVLFGVDARIEALLEALEDAPPHTVALTGPGGIGKSTLAHAAASRLIDEERYAEVVWLALDGPAAAQTVMAALARELGYPHLAASGWATLEAGLRARLGDAPALVVVDNAGWLEEPGVLLPRLDALIRPGRLLVVMRHRPPDDVPIRQVGASPLGRTDFGDLLDHHARLLRIPADRRPTPDAIDQLYDVLGGNPLAGRLAISQLAVLPPERVLDGLPDVEAVEGVGLFDWLFRPTWEALPPEAHRAALALALLPHEGAGWHVVAEASRLRPTRLDNALRALVDASLVEAAGDPPRYTMHALARLFVETQAGTSPHEATYAQLFRQAVDRERQGDHLPGDEPTHASRALALLDRGLGPAADPAALADLVARAAPAVRRAGQWAAWRDALRRTADLMAARAVEDAIRARVLLELGVAHRWLGEMAQAESALRAAVEAFGAAGDFPAQAEALIEIGRVYEARGRTEPAYEAYQRAAAAAHRYERPILRRQALNRLAGLALHNRLVEQGLDLLEQAAAIGPPDGRTLSNLGMVYLQAGDAGRAMAYQREALALFEAGRDLPNQARAHLRLGMAAHDAGDDDSALRHMERGLELMQTLGDALGQARTLTSMGAVYAGLTRWPDALSVWEDALALQERLNDEVGVAYTWYNLGDLYWRLDRPAEAREALAEARALAERLNDVTLRAHVERHSANV